MAKADKKTDCYQCAHFAVTWEPAHPRACRLFGFKTTKIPSVAVLESSGSPCEGFVQKRNAGNKKNPGGRYV